LASLEEIVDWQPYEHVGYRLAVAGLGPILASVDLEPVPGGTRVRLRWGASGDAPDLEALRRAREARRAAFRRLVRLVARQAGRNAMEGSP
jgi:hypothetical protein